MFNDNNSTFNHNLDNSITHSSNGSTSHNGTFGNSTISHNSDGTVTHSFTN